MGLDMYLHARVYLSKYNEKEKLAIDKISKNTPKERNPLKLKPKEIILDFMYWRKSNMIHRWFVENVQEGVDDCGDYYVDVDKLKNLLYLCKEVLADPNKADLLLPVQKGFFFGGEEYEEWYFEDLKETSEKLDVLFDKNGEFKKEYYFYDFYYSSSW